MPRKRPEVHIRKSEFPEGLRLCRENALSFLESAKILIDAKQINHAVILFQFAKEEAGKLAWLLTLSKGLPEVIQIPRELFSTHKDKSEKAEDFFGIESWVVKPGFDKRCFYSGPEGGYDLGIESDHDTRLKCAFVDYNDITKCWIKPGIDTDKEVFLGSIERAKEKLNQLSLG